MGVGAARGKLLFIGEHAAVHGYPCVGLTLPWSVEARWSETAQAGWSLPDLGPHGPAVKALLEHFTRIAGEEGLPPPVPGRLDLTSTLALSSGLGSSGALCAALTNLFWPGLPLETRDRLAWKGEAMFHGTPSGIDTCLALRQGWWLLEGPQKPVRATALPTPGVHLVVGAVVRQGDTKSLVGSVGRRKAEGDPSVVQGLETLGALAEAAARAVASADEGALPALVNGAREALAGLGLETPALTRILDGGPATGALAGKLSGAGGGGAFFLLYPDRETARAALPALEVLAPAPLWTCRPSLV